jgi:hypothetical protein
MIASLATSQIKLSQKKKRKTPLQRLYAHKEIGIVYEVF